MRSLATVSVATVFTLALVAIRPVGSAPASSSSSSAAERVWADLKKRHPALEDGCLERARTAIKTVPPKLDGTPREWLAATCPGVFLFPGMKNARTTESLFESCVWGVDHGQACSRCNTGYTAKSVKKLPRGYGKNIWYYHVCAMRYKYELKNWKSTQGKMLEERFIAWTKKEGKDTVCKPAQFDVVKELCGDAVDEEAMRSDGSGDDHNAACVWGATYGAKCMQNGADGEAQTMDSLDEAMAKMCVSRYVTGGSEREGGKDASDDDDGDDAGESSGSSKDDD